MKKSNLIPVAALILPSLLFSITDATYAGGNWNNNGSWTYNASPNVFPDGIDTTARFAGVSGNAAFGESITVGHMFVSGGTVEFQGSGLETFTFSVSSGNATVTGNGSGSLHVYPFAPIPLSSPLTVSAGGSDIQFAGVLTGSQDLTVTGGSGFIYIATTAVPFTEFTGNLILESSIAFDQDSSADPVFGGFTGTGTVTAGGLVVNSVTPSTFSGSMGTDTVLTKRGPETFTMDCLGGNMFQLLIQEGTVAASSLNNLANTGRIRFDPGGLSESASLHITGNTPFTYPGQPTFNEVIAEFNIDSTTALTLSSNTIQGSSVNSSIRKTGGGELIISASPMSFTSPITISDGTLTISGTNQNAVTVNGGTYNITGSCTGATTVNSGGILKGTGTLQNVTVNAGGTIRPGNSIGTLHVSGDLDLIGITQIEISPSSSSQIQVTGVTSLLGGTVNVIQDAGTYPSSGSYPIIVSDGGILGLFNPTVTGGNAGFSFSLDYSTPDTVTLVYELSSFPIPTTNLTGQANRFARYLNQYVPTSTATQALFAVPVDQLQAALDSASPSRNAFAPFAVQNTMISLSDLVSGHLVDQRFYHAEKRYNPNVAALIDDASSFTADASGRMFYSRTCESQSVWIGVIGEYAHQAALDQNPAFNFWSGGSLIGWDFYGNQNLFGFSGGAAYTHLIQDENGGNAKIEYYFASIYDTFYASDIPFYMEFALWGVYNQIQNYRNISFPGFEGTASATFHSWELVPHLGFGYHASYCCFSIEPFAQFDLVVDWQEGFKEHGVGAFDMTHVSRNSQFLRSEGGLRFYKTKQTSWGVWMGIVRGSLVNKKAFGTGSIAAAIVGTNALFNVETFRNTQNLGAFGLEMLWRWGQRNPVTFSLAYTGEFGSQFWSQEAMVRLMKDF